MAKQRYINTKFWADNFIVELEPIERYLFLYFLTNEHTNIGGVYELPMRNIIFETGLEKEVIEKSLVKFSESGKIFQIDGWIYVKNFSKHQAVNEKTKIGIEKSLKAAAPNVLAKIKEINEGKYGVSMGYQNLSQGYELSKLKLKPKLKLKLKPKLELESKLELFCEAQASPDEEKNSIPKVIEKFKELSPALNYGNKTQRKACEEMIAKFGLEETLRMIDLAINAMQSDKFCPRAVTPHDFWQKIGAFKVYFAGKNNQQQEFRYDPAIHGT